MLTQERHEAILKILSEKGSISVAELTKTLGVSESTVRRDLILLSNRGNLKKIHGGATLTKKQFIAGEDTVSDKSEKNIDEKRRKDFKVFIQTNIRKILNLTTVKNEIF